MPNGTMKPRAVVTNRVDESAIADLAARCEVVANASTTPWRRDEVLARARDAEALMVFMPDAVDDDFLAQCPRLRIVAGALKGADNFDVAACTRRGIWFTVVPDLLTEPTAELAVGLMIGLARNVAAGDAAVRTGGFAGWRPVLYGTGLADSMVGLIGAGAVGAAIARRLTGFGCRMIYSEAARLDPGRERQLGLQHASVDEVAAASDFVVVACPLTAATSHFVGAGFLAAMKPGAYLVNISRGSVVDEAAVADALDGGALGGYAADVFELEDWARPDRPRAIDPRLLADRENTLFTPHLGSAVTSVRNRIAAAAARAIVQCLDGEEPDGALNRPADRRG